jgi:hypothetical protein
MSDARFTGYAPCWACHQPFWFDVDTVPSVPIDPATNLPPDLGGTPPERAVRRPICPECQDYVTAKRGFNPWM